MKFPKQLRDTAALYAAAGAVAASMTVLGGVALLFDSASRADRPLPAELDAPALAVCEQDALPALNERERDRCRARVLAQLRRSGGTAVREAATEKPRQP